MSRLLCIAALLLGAAGAVFAQTTPPTPTPATMTVHVSWSEATAGATFNVHRWTKGQNGFAVINTAPITGLTYDDTTALVGTAYTYTVSAVNSAGESAQSQGVDITVSAPITVPAVPTNLKVTVVITN